MRCSRCALAFLRNARGGSSLQRSRQACHCSFQGPVSALTVSCRALRPREAKSASVCSMSARPPAPQRCSAQRAFGRAHLSQGSRSNQHKCRAELWSGKAARPPVNGMHHFLHIDDFSADELRAMLRNAARAKTAFYNRDVSFRPFEGWTMAMIFTKPSARTRVSFETVRATRARALPCKVLQDCLNARACVPALICCTKCATFALHSAHEDA